MTASLMRHQGEVEMGNTLLDTELLELRSEEEREPCLIEAQISLGAKRTKADCLIKDISIKGAKLSIETDRMLPKSFLLIIPINTMVSQTIKCEMRWRIGNTVGVKFN